MKTKLNQLMSLLLMVAVILGFTACANDDPHEGEGGVAIALDNSRCPNVSIGHTYLYIYDTGGNLCATYDYADAYAVASALLPLEAGHYTVATVINADEAPTETATLTALHEWVAAQIGIDSDLISGIAEMDVAENRVVCVAIPLSQDAFSLPVLSVRFAMPEATMPNFIPSRTRSIASNDNYSLRCVAELYKAGTDQIVLHKAVTPKLQEDGTYKVDLQLSEGDYDLRLWADYAHTDAPLADAFYHTESLKAVTLFTEPYMANTDAKDVAYGNESGITLPKAGATITLPLQRPFAKYRIIANDVEGYRNLIVKGEELPQIEDLTVRISYESFFPAGFNVEAGAPNDAFTGISYAADIIEAEDYAPNKARQLGSDFVLTNGKESFVTITVHTFNRHTGKEISKVSGVQIPYRRGYLTTVTGTFLTAGLTSGGVQIDTEWGEDIVIPF